MYYAVLLLLRGPKDSRKATGAMVFKFSKASF